jgi:hypothetical protein
VNRLKYLLKASALLLNLDALPRLTPTAVKDDRDCHQANCLAFAGPHDLDGALDRLDRVAPRKSLHFALGLGRASWIAGVSRQVMAALVALRRQDFARQRHGMHVRFSVRFGQARIFATPYQRARFYRNAIPKIGDGPAAVGERLGDESAAA